MKSANGWLRIACVALVAALARGDDAGWQFHVGGVYQWGMKMNTRGPALTTPDNYSGAVLPAQDAAGVTLADPNNQTYADGYVRRDWYMDVPGASGANLTMTWNWSYNSYANQYNAVNQTLAFHRGETGAGNTSSEANFTAGGVGLSAKHPLFTCYGLKVDAALALDLFPEMKATQIRSASSRFNTYYYSDSWGVVPGVPATGYQGPDYNYNNPSTPSDAGNLDLPPISYAPILVTDTLEQTVVSTKAELYRVRTGLGPELMVPLTQKLSLYASPKMTVSLVHAELTRNQTTTSTDIGTGTTTVLSSSEASKDKTALLLGFLMAAGIDYKIAPNWVIGAEMGHEWMPDNMCLSVGPDRTRLNLGGYEASCYVGMTF